MTPRSRSDFKMRPTIETETSKPSFHYVAALLGCETRRETGSAIYRALQMTNLHGDLRCAQVCRPKPWRSLIRRRYARPARLICVRTRSSSPRASWCGDEASALVLL